MSAQPFAIPAFLLFLVAVPLVLGLIPPNRLYGFRTAKTLSDEGIWYRVNRLAGFAVMIASAVYVAVAAGWPYDRAAPDNFSIWLLHLAAFAGTLVVGLGVSGWYAKGL
ncbi:MAG TPA: SdpI family protein [Thermoanaerobaculia bacterium]